MADDDDAGTPGSPAQREAASVDRAWRPGAASGVGSLPGGRPREAVTVVAGELPDLPHVPELPARGPGADMVGRTGGLLAGVSGDLALQTTPTGWRLADAPGRDSRRAISWLGEDLDAVEERMAGYIGPLKAQVVGPWTMAAAVELRSGERVLRDPGARRELAEALAQAVADHVADLRRRVPGADVVLQFDEPGLPAVLAGAIATQSGLSSYAPIDAPEASAALRGVFTAAAGAGALAAVHCCADGVPYAVLAAAGARALSIDLTRHRIADDEALGTVLETGVRLLAGVVPTSGNRQPSDAAAARPVLDLGHRLGLGPERLGPLVALTPTCGLAGASPSWVRMAYAACRAAGRGLRDEDDASPEGEVRE